MTWDSPMVVLGGIGLLVNFGGIIAAAAAIVATVQAQIKSLKQTDERLTQAVAGLQMTLRNGLGERLTRLEEKVSHCEALIVVRSKQYRASDDADGNG